MSTSNRRAFGIWSHLILGLVAVPRIRLILRSESGLPTISISRFLWRTRAINLGRPPEDNEYLSLDTFGEPKSDATEMAHWEKLGFTK